MFFERLKKSPKNRFVILIVIFGLVIVLIVYFLIFMPIEGSVPTYGILDYEFAWTQSRVENILSVWGVEGINKQSLAIYWDFIYIVGYVSLALGLIILILRISEEKIQKIGFYFTLTPFLTGLFDIIENINLLIMLSDPISISNFNPFIASLSALIKFSFLFAAIAYFLVALTIAIFKKFKQRE
ncbi:MAG: hypothetical protein ACFE9I_02315 [Candidatus Hermodarchaeota archaeon]